MNFVFLKPPKLETERFSSKLFNEKIFYHAFIEDLENVQEEVIIESPFITTARMNILRPIFRKLIQNKIKVFILTRDPQEHKEEMAIQAENEIQEFETIGVQVFLVNGNHHRKIAILDRSILWEGSLNILSQSKSREIMRRLEGKHYASEIFYFLNLNRCI